MSKEYGVQRVLDLAAGLKGAVLGFGEREAEIERERRTRTFGEKRRFKGATAAEEARLQEELDAANEKFHAERENLVARFKQRGELINRAQTSAKRQLSEEVEKLRQRTVTEMQMRALRAKGGGKEALANAEARLEESLGQAAGVERELEEVRRSARSDMRGYFGFRRSLSPARAATMDLDEPDLSQDADALLVEAAEEIEGVRKFAGELRAFGVPRFFKFLPPWLLILLAAGGAWAWVRFLQGDRSGAWTTAGGVLAGFAVVLAMVYFVGGKGAKPVAGALAAGIERARRLIDASRETATRAFEAEGAKIQKSVAEVLTSADDRWSVAEDRARNRKQEGEKKIAEQLARVSAMNEARYRKNLEPLDPVFEEEVATLRRASEARIEQLQAAHDEAQGTVDAEHDAARESMEADWRATVEPIYAEAAMRREAAAVIAPEWEHDYLERWNPRTEILEAVRFARLEVDAERMAVDAGLTLAGAKELSVPLTIHLPDEGSLLFETDGAGRDEAIGVMNNIVLRLLATSPPGKLNFTVIDPIGLGENFAGVMHLADYEDSLINGRIWTQRGQIEEKLAELNEHIEKVIQMYLRNEYETITEYNTQAGNIAEKYYFVVIADFPSGFSDTAVKRLQSIALTGSRCGIYTLIHWDQRHVPPQEFVPETLRDNSIRFVHDGKAFAAGGKAEKGLRLVFDETAPPQVAVDFIHKIGKSSTDSNRVEVPFGHVAPGEESRWSESTTNELRVPIGRTGATKLQYLAIGKGTRQHALFAGKTGSGKSTLFHVIITNLALWCSPEEVEFYLVDFKKGVEFKCYGAKRLPHARVVAIESDREFGLSVLQRVDEELKKRGDMFRKLGVQDIPGYKRAGGKEPVPRSLLIIDEFQELFVEDDRISQGASVLLDRIVRQGRAFGIHVLLGSQTLGGAFTLARTTLGQMVIRVALQCNEADAYLIMDDSNPAPRLLTRPGEGIYNDSAGSIEANSPFQVVWLPDDERDDWLDKVTALAHERGIDGPGPIVFEGNAPAAVRDNPVLGKMLKAPSLVPAPAARVFLGAPNSIKGPTEALFNRQSGNNLLVVGQREEAELAIISVAMVSLAAQFPKAGVRFIVFDGTAPGSPESGFLDSVIAAIPHEVTVAKNHDIPNFMQELDEELKRRIADEKGAADAPAVFLLIYGLPKFKKLRHEDDFDFSFDESATSANPGKQFGDLIEEGASHGMHVIATVDTFNNVNRFLSRKALSEFEMRVVFQMSANDSASLVDTPDASQLGLHRALFFNEHEGYLETFRPYALPGSAWVEAAGADLQRLAAKGD